MFSHACISPFDWSHVPLGEGGGVCEASAVSVKKDRDTLTLTFSGDHRIGRYAFYWNAYLFCIKIKYVRGNSHYFVKGSLRQIYRN